RSARVKAKPGAAPSPWLAPTPAFVTGVHRSVSVFDPGPSFSKPPTAVQPDGVGQATETPLMSWTPGRVGVGWIRHDEPFHRSANVPVGLPEASNEAPTATHAEGAGHEMPLKPFCGSFDGVGAGAILHTLPFQRSVRTNCPPVPLEYEPTPMQLDA